VDSPTEPPQSSLHAFNVGRDEKVNPALALHDGNVPRGAASPGGRTTGSMGQPITVIVPTKRI